MGWFESVREHAIDIILRRVYIREHASYHILHLTSHCFHHTMSWALTTGPSRQTQR
jgi:hypothetical protein